MSAPAARAAPYCAAAVFALAATLYRVRTYDTLFHLAAGRLIVRKGTVPATDPFSFSARGAPWTNHSWGYDVMLAQLHALGGFRAVSLLQAALAAALVLVAIAASARGSTRRAALAGVVISLPVLAFREVLEARPHVVGFLCLSISAWLAGAALRTGRARVWLGLLPVYAVWACTHGSHLLGLAVAGAALPALALHTRAGSDRRSGRLGRALLWPALTLAALLAQNLALAPVSLWQGPEHMASTFLEGSVSEWYPVAWRDLLAFWPGRVFLVCLALTWWGVACVHRAANCRAPELHARTASGLHALLLLVVLSVLAFTARRMIPLMLLGGAPVWLPYAIRGLQALLPARLDLRWVLSGSWLALVVALALVLGQGPARFGMGLDHARFPERAVDVMQRDRSIRRVYNAYNYGGYLMYRGVPAEGVLVDGRAITVYPPALLALHQRAYDDPRIFERLAAQFAVDAVLMPVDSARAARLRHHLERSPAWRVRYRDAIAVLYQPRAR